MVWEDEHLLVVDKPAGVVVHPGAGHDTGTLVHGLLALDAAGGDEERPGDRAPARPGHVGAPGRRALRGGARAPAGADPPPRGRAPLSRARPGHAEVANTGRIEAPIGRDRVDRTRHSLDTATPREAVTRFEVVERLGARALLELTLETGRTHQIRVHLEAIGLPVCGRPRLRRGGRPRARASVPARRRAGVRPPLHRRAGGGHLAAPGRPRGRAGARPTGVERHRPRGRSGDCPRTRPEQTRPGKSSATMFPQAEPLHFSRVPFLFVPATRTGGGASALSQVPPAPRRL